MAKKMITEIQYKNNAGHTAFLLQFTPMQCRQYSIRAIQTIAARATAYAAHVNRLSRNPRIQISMLTTMEQDNTVIANRNTVVNNVGFPFCIATSPAIEDPAARAPAESHILIEEFLSITNLCNLER